MTDSDARLIETVQEQLDVLGHIPGTEDEGRNLTEAKGCLGAIAARLDRLTADLAAAREALEKAADTFSDIGTTMMMLNRPIVREACGIAERETRAAIARLDAADRKGEA